ncbi:hypothetical protein [Hymenobacter lapidarius]|nr:hypothetical protein [Hymenobacter lapidarius]
MSYADYARYLAASGQFLRSPELAKFSSAANAQILTNVVLTDLKLPH